MGTAVHMSHCNLGDYIGTCKYGEDDDCPALQSHPAPELMTFLSKGEAHNLHKAGYICISNKYHIIGRPDREDWHMVLAKMMNCAPADFYMIDGTGLSQMWLEHYVRVHTTDKMEVSEETYNYMKKMM